MTSAYIPARLASLLAPIERPEPVDASRTYRLLGARWYAQGLFVKDEKSGQNIKAKTVYQVNAGDFVYNRLFAWKGSFAIADDQADGCYVSNEFPCFAVDRRRVEPSYLKWWFSRESTWRRALGLSAGATPTSRNRLKEERLLGMSVPLPPLHEQRRVVARIEALSAKTAEAQRLRQEAANQAVQLYSASVSRLAAAHGYNDVKLDELLGVTSLKNGRSTKSVPADTGVRCLTVGAVREGRVDVSNSKPVPLTPDEARPILVAKHDVFIVRGNGSKELCGRAGMVMEDVENTVFPDLFIRVSLPRNVLEPSFFVAIWNSPALRSWIEEEAKTTSGIWKINQGHIQSARIPLPPLTEQRRVVSELNALRAKVDAVKALQADTAAELNAMLPAILDKAFKGEL